jgi:hypothetical protein
MFQNLQEEDDVEPPAFKPKLVGQYSVNNIWIFVG